jgi:hypothetical protein
LPRAPGNPVERVTPHDVSALVPAVSLLIRRLSWGGDGRRGVARIEIGGGALAGATLLVVAEAGEVSVELDAPDRAAATQWAGRLGSALEARGVRVAAIDVR